MKPSFLARGRTTTGTPSELHEDIEEMAMREAGDLVPRLDEEVLNGMVKLVVQVNWF
tara:strand:- start:1002 stop:1172 length:171 start_codon:yes stop_codon:yes gene_type:complete